MEFLKLTLEWKLVIACQQTKVRSGRKARTHEWDPKAPACEPAAAGRAPAPWRRGLVPGPAP